MQTSIQESTIHTPLSVRNSFWKYIDEINKTKGQFKIENNIHVFQNMMHYIMVPDVQRVLKHNSFLKFRRTLLDKIKELQEEPYMIKKKLSLREQSEWPQHNTLKSTFNDALNEAENYLLNIHKRYLEREKRKAATAKLKTTTNETLQKKISVKVLPRRSARLMAKHK